MPALPRAAIFRPMFKRSLLALPAIAGAALLATRLVPGSLPDGSTLLPSGWRIRPAGRVVPIGTLPLNLVTLSDGSVIVTNDGYGENRDRKSTRLNSSHSSISYAVFCLKKKKNKENNTHHSLP